MQTNKLFVKNISFNTTESQLKELFATCGEVASARVATDRVTGRSRGFAFIEMSSNESAEEAIRILDQQHLDGRSISVAKSEPPEKRDSMAYRYGV